LTASDLAAVRGGREVFSGLSFTLAPGDLVAVTGANGSGKSTLLRVVAGLLRPAAGTLLVEPAGERGVAGITHYLGHLDGLKTALTVRGNLDFWRRLWGGPQEAAEAALDAVGLLHLSDLPAGVLSAGQKRRVAIARLLVAPRPLWLLDEPATALDAAAEANLDRLIAAHLATGGMAMVATHRAGGVPASATLAMGALRAAAPAGAP
jgi:heme exporter protein A